MLTTNSFSFSPITSKNHKPNIPKRAPSSKPTSLTSLTTQTNILLSTCLKTKTITQSLQLFQLLPYKDTITYNTIISHCSNHPNHFSTCFNLFFQMISFKDTQPDILTFRALLKVCVETGDEYYPLGVQVHGWIVKCFGSCNVDLITSTYLINFYGQFGTVDFARNVFDEISVKDLDLFAFSSLMGCYNKAGMYDDVLKVLRYLMDIDGLILPNAYVLTCGLSACASLFSLFEGRQIHAYIVKGLLGSDVFVGTALINMYIKCNDVDCAKKSFLEIETPTVVAWNALMAGEFSSKEVLKLFEKMSGEYESDLHPDHVTLATVLRACKDVDLYSVRQIHNLVIKTIGVEVDVFIGGALFDIYVDNGCVSDAEKVLDAIREKDLTAYNLAIQGYRRNGHRQKAERLFHEALQMDMELNEETLRSLLIRVQDLGEVKQLHALITKLGFTGNRDSDLHISTSLLSMYAEFQCSDDAIRLFHQVHFPDLILWTSMISGFSISGESQKALDLYVQMLKGLAEPPNHYTFSSILRSCASLAAWNAMITGLAQHGHAEMAIEVFQGLLNMPNTQPNHITFVGVLSACSYCGLVEEGYRYFKLIKEPTIDHYTCLIDLLGRAGRLEEALNVVEEMPFNPNEIIWSSLLSASTIHCNIMIAQYAANNLLQLNPKDSGTYVALANIYAGAGRWEDANKIRKLMNDRGLRKNPGQSWLMVNGETHIFLAVDKRKLQQT